MNNCHSIKLELDRLHRVGDQGKTRSHQPFFLHTNCKEKSYYINNITVYQYLCMHSSCINWTHNNEGMHLFTSFETGHSQDVGEHTCFVFGISRMQNRRLVVLTEGFLNPSKQILEEYYNGPSLINYSLIIPPLDSTQSYSVFKYARKQNGHVTIFMRRKLLKIFIHLQPEILLLRTQSNIF
jgi:hypothetical protein